MKKIKFYMCPTCGNVITATGEARISCCSRTLEPLIAKPADDMHSIRIESIEEDYYITFNHPMSKEHYISFAAYVTYDKMLFVRLYPEQSAEVRFPRLYGGRLYLGCSRDGLWVNP